MNPSTCEFIDVLVEEKILRIKINRPEKMNAINRDMYAAMADAIQASNQDSSVRVIVIEGSEGCFTSGNDLKDFMGDPEVGEQSSVERFIQAVLVAEKPIVAAVTGLATGIGTTMLLHCDLVYASEKASFNMPFINLGLVPEFGSSLLLPHLVGQRRASEMLMLGKPFSAETAQAVGIVNDVVSPDQVIEIALTIAKTLAALPSTALRLTKKLMKQPQAEAIAHHINVEGELFEQALSSPEANEAFTAVMEKRKPNFSQFD